MEDRGESVDAILADPKFDIEHFIHNVTLHFEKPNILRTLIADPAIRLAIAESDNYALLVHLPGSPEDFFKMSTLDLETWCKKTRYNVWYGIVAHDDLAIGYRRVNGEPEVVVWKGEGSAKSARSRWRQLKLQELGAEKDVASVTPGQRHIDLIRKDLWDKMKKLNFTHRGYYADRKLNEGILADFGLRTPGGYDTRKELRFRVESSGAKNIRVYVQEPTQSRYDHKTWENIRISTMDTDGSHFPIDNVTSSILNWLKSKNKLIKKAADNAKVSV
jgi:hypothetical protein